MPTKRSPREIGMIQRYVFIGAALVAAILGQDVILEPYAGQVFGFTPGQSTGLSGVQHGGTGG